MREPPSQLRVTSPFSSYLFLILLLYFLLIIYPVHPTGFSFCFFPGFLPYLSTCHRTTTKNLRGYTQWSVCITVQRIAYCWITWISHIFTWKNLFYNWFWFFLLKNGYVLIDYYGTFQMQSSEFTKSLNFGRRGEGVQWEKNDKIHSRAFNCIKI